MKRISTILLASLLLAFTFSFVSISSQPVQAQDDVRLALAQLRDTNGAIVGNVSFTQTGGGVLVSVQTQNLPSGFHGFHIHSVGECDSSSEKPFSSSGGHHNPDSTGHSTHDGDLPALLVMDNGTGLMTVVTDRIHMTDLLDADGSAIIIHANPDNYANIPERYGAVDEETMGAGDAGGRIACGIIQSAATVEAGQAILAALSSIPLDLLPASVIQEENAASGTVVVTVPSLNGAQFQGQATSTNVGTIGTARIEGDLLIFTFTELDYEIAPISFGSVTSQQQTISIDKSQSNTITVNLTTGEFLRDFHYNLTSSDVLYNGQPSIPLGDTGKTEITELTQVSENLYTISVTTHWRSQLVLDSLSVGDVTVAGGEIEMVAEFHSIYTLDFSQ